MAIQESDIMDFGNGIIGDDTFDVWRKKTNRVKVELDSVNTTLTTKINTDVANLSTVYIPQSGSATSVSTALQFTNNITLSNSNLIIGSRTVSESAGKLSVDGGIASTTSVEANTVQANSNLSLGTKTYSVPSSPAINNAVLVTQTDGTLSWQNVSDIFTLSGGLNQTTTVFEEVMPVGSVIPLAGEPNDPNFLLCEGGTVSKDTYPDLFDVIGYSYDTGLSGDQFRLPDYRGRVLVGTQGTSVTFPSSFGAKGGTETLSTSGHALTIDEMPKHDHVPNRNTYGTYNGLVRKSTQGYNTSRGVDTTVGEIDILNKALPQEEGGDVPHSHNITASNRVQPYVTVKWYIKAIKNSKVDFKINIANSGLKSTTFGGEPQTLISPVDETIALSINPDNTSIALDNDFKVSVKSSPTIQGTITATGNVISEEPTASNHLTTKNYVDTRSDGIRTVTLETPFGAVRTDHSIEHGLGGVPNIVQKFVRFNATTPGTDHRIGELIPLYEGTTWSGTIGQFGTSVTATHFKWGHGGPEGHEHIYFADKQGSYDYFYGDDSTLAEEDKPTLVINLIRFI
jgi:microcystin-dependent protein